MRDGDVEQASISAPASFAFGPFVLLPDRQLLLKYGDPVRIGGRALAILIVLIARAGTLVTKREIFDAVWPGLHVEEDNLKVNIAALRRVLGQSSEGVQYIVSVSGRGYQFAEPVQSLGTVELRGKAETSPPSNNNLPNIFRRVFGRTTTIEAVQLDFQRARLVSIVGPGGIGKTTVALAVAEESLGSFRDGVWFVDLGPLTDPRLVASAIAQSLGLAAQSSNMLAAVVAYLRPRETLLVLDNCEHLLDEVASCVARILGDCANSRILATSRETLSLPVERVRRLEGLESAPAARNLSVNDALDFPAIRLFVDRAVEKLESFCLTDANVGMVAEICRKLDGLALAIELVATHVETFGIAELLQQLDERHSSLKGYRDNPQRHRTLQATMDWSYELLSNSEKTVLRRLSTFAGAFELNSACMVSVDTVLDRATVTESLANLVAKSLIVVEAGEYQLRYAQPYVTQAYARSKLEESNELDIARMRHTELVLELARRAAADTESIAFQEWLAKYGALVDEIRLAMKWAAASSSRGHLLIKLTVAAIPLWKRLSLLEEGRTASEEALRDAFSRNRQPLDDLVLNLAIGSMGLHTRGPTPQIKLRLTKALEAAEELGERALALESLRALSEYHLWTSDSKAAIETSKRIREIASTENPAAEGDADAQTGTALRWIGELDRSRHYLESVIGRPISNHRRSEAGGFEFNQRLVALGSLAQVLWLQGFPDRAVQLAAEQLAEAETTNHSVSLCSALIQSTAIALFVGDLESADKYLVHIDEHAAAHGLNVWRAMGRCHRGRWLYDAGKPVDLVTFRAALTELHVAGFRMRYPAYLAHFSLGQAQHGDFDGALSSIDEVMERCRSNGHSWGIPEALRLKATYELGNGDTGGRPRALDLLDQSIRMAHEQGAHSWELRSAITLAEAVENDQPSRAIDKLGVVYQRFTEGFDTVDLVRARQVLRVLT